MPAVQRIRFRRGTAADWTAANPILAAGEPGFEVNTGSFKIGDDVTPWSSLPYADAAGVPSGGVTTDEIVKVSGSDFATSWRKKAVSDVRDFGVVGDGVADDTVALQAAFNSGQPIVIPTGTTIMTTAQITIPSGLELRLDGRIERTWNGGGLSRSGAMFTNPDSSVPPAPIENVKIIGSGSVGAQSLAVGSGQIFTLDCDDLLIRGITVDTYWFGQAFLLMGDRVRLEGVKVLNSAVAGGNGGIRFCGGVDFAAVGCHVESGDDALQFVPPESNWFTRRPTTRGVYVGCTGASTAGRFLAVIAGGDLSQDISHVSFMGCHGKAAFRGVIVSNQDTSSANISHVNITDCSVDCSADTQTVAQGALYVERSTSGSGALSDINIDRLRIISPSRRSCRVIGTTSRVRLRDCDFGTERNPTTTTMDVESCDQFEMVGGRVAGGGTARTIFIGSAGTPTNARLEGVEVHDTANGANAIALAGGSGHLVRRCKPTHASGATAAAGVRIETAATGCRAIENDLSALTATNLISIANGTTATCRDNKAASSRTVAGTTLTLQSRDSGGTVYMSSASAKTVTLDADTNQTLGTDDWVRFVNTGAGTLTFVAGGGVTVNVDPAVTLPVAQHSALRVTKTAPNVYLVGRS